MPIILYNLASRSRPEKAIGCIENIISMSKTEDYLILLVCDIDDDTMFNQEMIDKINSYPRVKISFGTSKNKIHAINREVNSVSDFDILFNVSDDQLFLMDGFDLEVIKDFETHFPDMDGFLHYPDSHAKDKLPTMSIMGKKYYDIFGYIYHPEYSNVYADNEAMDVAKILFKYKFIDKIIYDHFHPIWGMAEMDEQYKKSENPISYSKDREVYERRKTNKFYL